MTEIHFPKLVNFQCFMRFFNIGNIYPTRARPFGYYEPCVWIDTATENMKSEILYENVQHPEKLANCFTRLINGEQDV